MKTIIEMAREAGLHLYVNDLTEEPYALVVERFAELVRADERDRAMRENAYVLAEREACAKVAEEHMRECEGKSFGVGAAIRARGNT